jgi:glycosyltransferase involved in cell wall biosynthesis
MIVKNEEHVIERCLASVLPVMDYAVIVDTGSTDNTKKVISNFFDQIKIPYEIHDEPWKNFAHNRTVALDLARSKGDYTLMIDADEILEYTSDFDPIKFRESLTADLYNVWAFFGNTKYHRPQLTSNKLRFAYRGVLHEYSVCHDEIKTRDFAPGILNRPIQDGARSKNPTKYADDAITFEKALADPEQRPSDVNEYNRYLFYLAQSYRDSGQHDKAIKAYYDRANAGGWNEEVFFSLFQIGELKRQLGHSVDEIVKVYLEAWQVNPWRAEPLHAAAAICKIYGRFDQSYRIIKEASRIPVPKGALFVIEGIYSHGVPDELSAAAFWTERYAECIDACNKLLQLPLPPTERQRIERNLKISQDRLAAPVTGIPNTVAS